MKLIYRLALICACCFFCSCATNPPNTFEQISMAKKAYDNKELTTREYWDLKEKIINTHNSKCCTEKTEKEK